MFKLLIVLLLFSSSALGLSVASWNILQLGWADNKKGYAPLVDVISQHDFVALQEVMSTESLDKLNSELNKTGHWDIMVSHRSVGDGRYREFFAFIYRSDRIDYMGAANLYLDPGNKFARKPFSAKFCETATGFCFTAATVHLIYGKTIIRRQVEAMALSGYVDYLRSNIAQGDPILLTGDFNLDHESKGFEAIKYDGFTPLFSTKTTLSKSNNRHTSAYDNIWVNTTCRFKMCRSPSNKYIDKSPRRLGMSHAQAREAVSGHALVVASW
ncbi:MAG: hypothetical protein A6F72_07175 [Cycloclasticus sp. symbiont of Poecilosclerida sp. N]|nr:MAG: hypothetical protein A6F72_07175 [Cycloclasticus sp. symbiont of Poecilosclerida sp. N]